MQCSYVHLYSNHGSTQENQIINNAMTLLWWLAERRFSFQFSIRVLDHLDPPFNPLRSAAISTSREVRNLPRLTRDVCFLKLIISWYGGIGSLFPFIDNQLRLSTAYTLHQSTFSWLDSWILQIQPTWIIFFNLLVVEQPTFPQKWTNYNLSF